MGGWDIVCSICGASFGVTDAFAVEGDEWGYDADVIEETGLFYPFAFFFSLVLIFFGGAVGLTDVQMIELEWLELARVLGFNPEAFGVRK